MKSLFNFNITERFKLMTYRYILMLLIVLEVDKVMFNLQMKHQVL